MKSFIISVFAHKNVLLRVGLVATARLARRFLYLITLPLMTKGLGAAGFGLFVQINTAISLLTPFAMLGVEIGVTRYLPGEQDRERVRRGFWAIALSVGSLSTLLTVGTWVLSAPFLGLIPLTGEQLSILQAASFLIFLSAAQLLSENYLMAFRHPHVYAILTLFQGAAEVLAIAYCMLSGYGVRSLFIVMIIAKAAGTLCAFGFIVRDLGLARPDRSMLSQYYRAGMPVFLSGFFYWIINLSDRYVIGYFHGLQEVGVYSAAYTLSNVVFAIGSFCYYGVLSAMARRWDRDEKTEVEALAQFSLDYFWLLAIPAAFGMSMLGPRLMHVFATEEFVKGWVVIPLVTSGLILYIGFGFLEYFLILAHDTISLLRITAIAACVNLLLNLLLVPSFSIIGAAVSTAFTFGLQAALVVQRARNHLPFKMRFTALRKTVLSSIGMAIVMIPLFRFGSLVLLVSAGAASYFLFAWLLGLRANLRLSLLREIMSSK